MHVTVRNPAIRKLNTVQHIKRCFNSGSDQLGSVSSEVLYAGHEPTTLLQRCALAVGSALMGLKEPTRSDMIAVLGETTGHSALRNLHQQMICDSVGQQILRERPLVNSTSINMEYLRSLPNGTFGKEYTKFMDGCNISADTRDPVRFLDHEELAYVMLRYRQIHDFTHLLTGFPSVSVQNEIAVKWFEMVHFGLPMCALAAIFAPVRLSSSERAILQRNIIPWALYAGYRSKLLLNVYFEKHFEQNIDEFRTDIGLIPSPCIL
ncbi:ubiquinone biosynthesis protein COQ4 homolog, mitochondrial-like [Rhopilema esculentum]|uniref:ubiquinone biosynthesis protein COQ4 homolog, mitochondrial-like n=1 Tax=Rhopilema esculentum TaxID=499914 RepID=UPI0031D89384